MKVFEFSLDQGFSRSAQVFTEDAFPPQVVAFASKDIDAPGEPLFTLKHVHSLYV